MAASTINTECKRYGCMKNLLACFANCRHAPRCDELRNELADKTAQAESDINHYLSERGRGPILVQILKRGVKFDTQATRPSRKPQAVISPAAVAAMPRPKRSVKPGPAVAPRPSLAAVGPHVTSPTGTRRAVKARRPDAAPKVRMMTKPRTARRAEPDANASKATPQAVTLPTIAGTPPRAALRLAAGVPRRPGHSRSRKRSKMPRKAKPETQAKPLAGESLNAPSPNSVAIAGKPEAPARATSERAAPRKKTAKARKAGGNGKVYIIIEGQTANVVDEQGLMMHLFSNHSKTTRYFEASEVEARVQIIPKR